MKTGRRAFAPLAVCAVVFCSCSDDEKASGGSGANGGSSSSGGSTGSGGSGLTGSGGSGASGGATGSDGSGASGGLSGSGGSGASGGSSGSGGSGATGGSSGSGGSGATGGTGGGTPQQPFKGVANSPCAARTALKVSWYYNWTQRETEPCTGGGGGEFVPMIWGHTGNEQSAAGIRSAVASFVDRGDEHVLGFNEPDNPGQSNLPVASAISLWPSFDNPAIRIGSPATAANANPGQAWFTDFMTELDADPNLRADFLAIHWYGWNAGSCDANAAQLESYIRWVEGFAGDRPIWITEWACLNQSAPDMATVVAFYNGAIAMFARHTRVERYAWYPWATNCGLNDSGGSLTALGIAYAAAPAYK